MRATPISLLALLACADVAPRPAPEARNAAPAAPAPGPVAATLDPEWDIALAREAEASWKVREIAHAPPHFLASGWTDDLALWGLAGTTLAVVAVDRPVYTVGHRDAWSATLSPDGARVAGIDGRGLWVATGAAEKRLLLARAPQPSEGDLTGPPLWSPDGARLLVRWEGEGAPVFGIVEVASGGLTMLPAGGDAYLLVEPFAWLDPRRIAFSAVPHLGTDGAPALPRDLAVYDLGPHAHRRVTRAPRGVALTPLALWGAGGLLVREDGAGGTGTGRLWIYDPRDGTRRPAPLPAGDRVIVYDTVRAVVVRTRDGNDGIPEHGLHLWEAAADRIVPLARVRGGDLRLAWSPDGRRLLVSRGGLQVPVEGMPGSFREATRTQVLEPRVPR